MRRLILINSLIIVAVLAVIGLGSYFWYNNYYFYNTDDARVTGSLVPITPLAAGTLASLNVKLGDTVQAGQKVGMVDIAGGNKTLDLTSPINGVVVAVPAVQNQVIVPGQQVATVVDSGNMAITAYIDESQRENVKVGQDVDIHIDAYSGTSFSGKVLQIVNVTADQFSLLPSSDNASGNFTKVGQRIPVIIDMGQISGKPLAPGMNASVTIHIH